ncbi:MAG: hypothetical protein HFG27_00815 [Provencibacterium sp.]|jgi:hypothetical protein|nr:hypothetical protein [Provencibacterium sp.]
MGKEKKKLSEFEKYKKQQNIQNKFNRILAVLMISALVLIFVFGLDYFSGSLFGGIFRSHFSGGGSFPVSLPNHAVRQLEAVNWDVALLSDSELLVFDNQGNERLSLVHGCGTPVLKTDGGRLLCYDQGGSAYHVASSSRLAYSGTAEGVIHAADIAGNGTMALATSTAKNATLVTFYDEFGNVTHSWRNSSMACAIALSPDGRQAAVVLYGVRGGGIVTSVVLLDLGKNTVEKPVFSMEIADEFGYYISFQEGNIFLITDQSVKTIDQSGRIRAEYDFDGQQIQMFADGGSHMLILLGNYRYMRSSQLVALDGRCRVVDDRQLDISVNSMRANENGFYLLSEGVVSHYDYKGSLISQVNLPGAAAWLPLGQNLYAATYEELQKNSMR